MEQRLAEQWLTHLPKSIVQHIVHIEEIGAGRASSAFIQLVSGLEYFAKHSKANLIQKEKLVLSELAQQSACKLKFPQLYPFETSANVLITEKLTGQTPTKTQVLQQQTQLIEALAELHQLEFEQAELDFIVPDRSKLDIALKESELLDWQRVQIQNMYVECESKLTAITSYAAINHGDLTPLNILLDESHWQLIDWEYACKTDVRWDLATLVIEFGLTKAEANMFAKEYQRYRQINDFEFVIGFECWQYFYLVTCLVWAVDNQTDISKYSKLCVDFVNQIKK